MKLNLADIKAKLKALSPWWYAIIMLVIICIGLLVTILLETGAETEYAFNRGARVSITLDGDIIGYHRNTRILEQAKEAAVKAEASATNDQEDAGDTDEEEKPKKRTTPEYTRTINEMLIERGPNGEAYPIKGLDGTKPWEYYAKPFVFDKKKPIIAIIITGLGHSRSTTKRAIDLSDVFTLSFSPYAANAKDWAIQAHLVGHEIWFDLPFEPENFPKDDPGPYALMRHLNEKENIENLLWGLSRYTGYVGVVSPAVEAFTQDIKAFESVIGELAKRGVLFAYGKTGIPATLSIMLKSQLSDAEFADVLIDEEITEEAIQQRLTLLEEIAKRKGKALGIARGYPITTHQLALWERDLPRRGIVLVPASALMKK